MQIRPLSYSLGAEIVGVDICQPLTDTTFGKIHEAFLQYGILLFRQQPLTPAQHVAFSRRFGALETNDAYPRLRHPEAPEILMVVAPPRAQGKPPAADHYQGNHWHSDLPYTLVPAAASILHSVEVPAVGGDTLFANMYRAYETLSDGMKKLIDGLYAIHSGGSKDYDRAPPPVAQPVARVHPETGRKSLYITDSVTQFVGLTAEESAPLIHFLCEHAARPQFVYRHQWRPHDLLMWDNRCMWHYALGDYDRTQLRHMERTTVTGTASGYVYKESVQ